MAFVARSSANNTATTSSSSRASARSCCLPRPVQRRLVIAASAAPQDLGKPRATRSLAVLGAVADLCEVQGLTSKFESLAGRSAMLGVSVALLVEAATNSAVLRIDQDDVNVFAAYAVVSVLAAGTLAALQSKPRTEAPALLQDVIASLTAAKGASASSSTISGTSKTLDMTVDQVMNTTFTREGLLKFLVDDAFYVDI